MKKPNPSKSYSIISFLKFGQEKYMKDLFYKGDLFFNSIQFSENLKMKNCGEISMKV